MLAANDNQPVRYGPWLPSGSMARAAGSTHYFTGKPCVRGHIELRHASNGTCLECTRIRVAIWVKEHPERMEQLAPERRLKASLDYAKNPEKYAARTRQSRERHASKYKERARRYRTENPEKSQSRVRNRRARIRNSEGTHNERDIEAILVRQKFKCAECGTTVKERSNRQVDHIMPIALGGANWPSNLQILCPLCNQKKNAKHPIDFARSNGRLL